ncbi:hypothetical protein BSLG_002100 [Batrachochytrium salamandrivorans]|nr:hypothetical protein BSLG_002100 [Batrachochytrium salamandrivorans]
MDTSKQALAASLIHFANVLVSSVAGIDAEGNEGRSSNPCVWYFLNLGLDTTVGVGILYLFLRGLHYLADVLNIPDTQSGVYGTPPRVFPWFKQLCIFITAWFFVKLLVVLALSVFPFFGTFGEWVLSPLAAIGDPRFQIVFVMLIFPLIMNIVQAWLIDMVIKGDSSQLRPGHTSSSSSSTVDRDRNLSQSWRTNTEEDLLESDHIHIEEPLCITRRTFTSRPSTRVATTYPVLSHHEHIQRNKGWQGWIAKLFGRSHRHRAFDYSFIDSSPLEADLVICDEPSTPNPELQSRTSIESEIDR